MIDVIAVLTYNCGSSKLAIQLFPTPKDQTCERAENVTQVQCKVQKNMFISLE